MVSSGWSLTRGFFHWDGLIRVVSPEVFFIRVVSHQVWSLIRVISQGGLSSGWSLTRVLSSGWSLIRVVSHQGGLTRVVSYQGGLSSGWSLTKVVSHEGFCSAVLQCTTCYSPCLLSVNLFKTEAVCCKHAVCLQQLVTPSAVQWNFQRVRTCTLSC